MGDMGDIFNDIREHKKMVRHHRANHYAHKLIAAGAVFLTEGVYRLGVFDCYPGKGYARHYQTNKRTSIEFVLKYNMCVNVKGQPDGTKKTV